MGRVVNAEELPCCKGSEFGSQIPNEESREAFVFEEVFCVLGPPIGEVASVPVRETNVDNVIIGFRSEVDIFGIATPIVWDPLAARIVSL